MCTIRLGLFAQHISKFMKLNDPRKLYTVDAPNQNVNKILGTLDGGNKGNDDAPTNKVYMRYVDALSGKRKRLMKLRLYWRNH
jgi:hypothetical protein